jgi:hypothetical protein
VDEQQAEERKEEERLPARGIAARLEALADAYGLVLFLLVAMLVAPALVPGASGSRLVAATLGVTAIIVALASSRIKHWALVVAIIAAAAAFLLVAASRADDSGPAVIGSSMLSALFFVTSVGMLVRIARHKSITVRTLYGAIAAYLMIGLGFALLYQAIEFANPSAINGTDLSQRGVHAYYSFTTLTTLGYGDITPVSIGARTAAQFEMLLGQVYLVVIVARIVSLLGSDREIEMQVQTRLRDALRTRKPDIIGETPDEPPVKPPDDDGG